MTCDNFKSKGFEEGGDVLNVAFVSSAGVDIEFFSCAFILCEDVEDFKSVDGFAGTKIIQRISLKLYKILNFVILPLGGDDALFLVALSKGVGIGGFRIGFLS